MKNRESFKRHRELFTQPRSLGANWVRYKIHNYHASLATSYHTAGDMENYARHRAIAEAARTGTLSLSRGPVVNIAERRAKRLNAPMTGESQPSKESR